MSIDGVINLIYGIIIRISFHCVIVPQSRGESPNKVKNFMHQGSQSVTYFLSDRLSDYSLNKSDSYHGFSTKYCYYWMSGSFTRQPDDSKLDGLATLVADPLRCNSTTRQNLPIWQNCSNCWTNEATLKFFLLSHILFPFLSSDRHTKVRMVGWVSYRVHPGRRENSVNMLGWWEKGNI